MLNKYMASIYIEDCKLQELTEIRNIGALPVGGRYRVIDFALSNLVNSGINNIGIFSKDEGGRALRDHIGGGEHWDLDRKKDGIFFFKSSFEEGRIGDIKILEKNLEYFFKSRQENIILINPSIVCNIDLKDVIEKYEKSKAEIFVVYNKCNIEDQKSFYGMNNLKINNSEVLGIGNLANIKNEIENISLDIFIMQKNIFLKMILDRIQSGSDLGIKNLIWESIKKYNYKIHGYEFKGYCKNINSIENYYSFNMDLLKKEVRDEIFLNKRKIYTKTKDTPSTIYDESAEIENSLIVNGCVIKGKVKNSILGRRVKIGEGVKIENSIIFQGCEIEKGAKIKNAIIDKNNIISSCSQVKGTEKYPLVIGKNLYIHMKKLEEILK